MWTASWYGSPTLGDPDAPDGPAARRVADGTVTTVAHLSIGGSRLRLRFSNLFGRTPLVLGAVTVTTTGSAHTVTFDLRPDAAVAPGATLLSDPVEIETVGGSVLTISVYYPQPLPEIVTQVRFAAERNVVRPGRIHADSPEAVFGEWTDITYHLVGVETDDDGARGAIVGLGDSITLGGSMRWPASPDLGAARRWPARLADRLAGAGRPYGVVNAGIPGNRLLRDGDGGGLLRGGGYLMPGQRALKRYDRDVLDQPGVRYAILQLGLDDIGFASMYGYSLPTLADDLVEGIAELADRGRRRGVRTLVTTLTPFEGTAVGVDEYYRPEKNDIRLQVNEWIRTTSAHDGCIDFEEVLADPRSPNRMNPELDSGDHIHPNDAGERALGEGIDLALFD